MKKKLKIVKLHGEIIKKVIYQATGENNEADYRYTKTGSNYIYIKLQLIIKSTFDIAEIPCCDIIV